MDNILLMNMLESKMRYGAAHQELISQNIANANTPEYRRRDMAKPNFKGMVKSSMTSLQTTHPNHIPGLSNDSLNSYSTGSKVELDMESFEMMKNSEDYEKASTTYKKMIGLMKDALGGNNS